jgi:Dolichyl-phosphate-mannose-protein mannosyltransferase
MVAGLGALRYGRRSPFLNLYGGGYAWPAAAVLALSEARAPGGDDRRGRSASREARQRSRVLAARWWSAVLSTATVAVVFAAGRALSGTPTGIVAALLVTSSTLAVREAHFAKADSAAAFSAAILLLTLVHPWRSRHARALAIGAAGALAATTKACIGLLPGAALALARPPERARGGIDRRSVAIGLVVLAVLVAAQNPDLVLHPLALAAAARSFRGWFASAHWLPGHDLVPGPARYHLWISLRWGSGAVFALLALAAVPLALLRRGPRRVIAVASLGYVGTLLLSPMVLARFLLPVVPLLAVLVADLVRRAIAAEERRLGRLAAAATALAALAIVAEPLARSARLVELLGRPDTRALAAEWVAENVPENAGVVTWGAPTLWTDYGAPPLAGRRALPRLAPRRWREEDVAYVIVHSYPLPYSAVPLPPGAPALRRVAVFDPFDGPTDAPVLEPLDAFYLPLARLTGVARPGPRIEIYELER